MCSSQTTGSVFSQQVVDFSNADFKSMKNRPLTALVVDDFEPFRALVCSELQGRGEFKVIDQAADGSEAIEKTEKLQPDLILLDIGLPTLNGMEVARQVRQLAPRAIILFLSQETSSDVVREALRIGALGYVHKPRVASDLLPAFEAVLAGRRFVSDALNYDFHHHEVLFFAEDTVLSDRLTHFIAAALTAGNPAMVVATESHRQDLLWKLRDQGIDVDAAIQQGTYISLDVEDPADPARLFEKIKRLIDTASKAGRISPRLALCGERTGYLWAKGKVDEAIRIEQICDDLATTLDVDVLCAYPTGRFAAEHDEQSFKLVCAMHSAVSHR